MSFELRILLGVVSVVFFAYVLLRVRKGKLLLPHAFVWLLIAVLGIFASVFTGVILSVARALGFETASNFVFFLIMLFALVFLFFLSMTVSKQTVQIKGLIQEIALLEARFPGKEEEAEGNRREGK